MAGRTLFRIFFAAAVLGFLTSCAEYPPTTAVAPAPTPPPMGYWNGDGVPGSPKIIVSISEQHAYFYKGKHLVGETTVSVKRRKPPPREARCCCMAFRRALRASSPVRVCPKCAGMMRFEERFAIVAGQIENDPAWVCLSPGCQYQQQVR